MKMKINIIKSKIIGYFLVITLFCFGLINCDITETVYKKNEFGTLLIILIRYESNNKLQKIFEHISSVKCFIKKGIEVIHNSNLIFQDNAFCDEIIDLEEGSDYSVFLFGKDQEDITIGFGSKLNIEVKADSQTVVEIEWIPQNPMIYIQSGNFIMGTNDALWEKPQHDVYLDSYYIDKYEITNRQYVAFLNESLMAGDIQGYYDYVTKNGHILLRLDPNYKSIYYIEYRNLRYFIINTNKGGLVEDYPVIGVTWYGAYEYAKHYGKRLPTEAEWEKAARGTDGRKYPWGNNPPTSSHCNSYFEDKYIEHPIDVGSYSPVGDSPYGCCDMSGNVWEWCADWFYEYYYQESPHENPNGPSTGISRVRRGGGWDTYIAGITCTYRTKTNPDISNFDKGFRCVKEQ